MPRRTRINRKPSPLPVWIVQRTSTRGIVKVTCPRRDCPGHKEPIWLRYTAWLRASEYMTRSCTFCFRTNKLPEPE